jgi:hypothetical protein
MNKESMRDVVDRYRRQGFPVLRDTGTSPRYDHSSETLTWEYADGSRESGSLRDFEEERDLAITMRSARGNPLAQRYIARFGMTYKELPIPRAAFRELLLIRRPRDSV